MTLDGAAPPADQWELTPEEMRRAARAGELLAATTPGAPRGASAPDGLPRVARLIGRDTALEETLAALASAEVSAALALIGPAGAGKSALAAEVVARAAERGLFPGGVVWLACDELSGDPGLEHLRDVVARALGDPPTETAPRPLLALDGWDSALDATALLDALAPWRAAILLTARRSPEDARVREESLAPLDAAASAEMIQHILHQIDLSRPNDADRAALSAELSAERGGETAPLALTLRAALAAVRETSVGGFSEHDGKPLAALNATWLALPGPARRAWAGLALIEGASFPRGAALALIGAALLQAAGVSRDGLHEAGLWRARAAETLDALIGLRLVSPLAAGRLALGPFLRRFASSQAGHAAPDDASGEAPGEALASWWLAFARAQAGHDGGPALAAEAPGLMGALAWAHARARHQLVLDLASAVNPAWRAAGRIVDLRRALAWSVEAARALDDAPHLRRALHDLALLDASAGRAEQARAGYTEALRLATELGDEQAETLERRGLAALDADPLNEV